MWPTNNLLAKKKEKLMSHVNFKNVLSQITTFKTLERFNQCSEAELEAFEAYTALPYADKKQIDLKHSQDLEIANILLVLGCKQYKDSEYYGTIDGRVFNSKTGKFLAQTKMKGREYLKVTLPYNGKAISPTVNKFIATCFHPNPRNCTDTNHDNNDPSDNRPSNIEWCTSQENIQHKVNQGRQARGETSGASKLKTAQVEIIKSLLAAKTKITEIAKRFNVSTNAIDAIRTNKTWKHI
jgi:hypothetical protein